MFILYDVAASGLAALGEVLPLDGTAHTALFSSILPPESSGRSSTLALSILGSAIGMTLVLSRDLLGFFRALPRLIRGRIDPAGRVFLRLGLASVMPLAILLIAHGRVALWHDPLLIALAMLIGAILLAAADHLGVTVHRAEDLGIAAAMILGVVQTLALLLPGLSRLGLCATLLRLNGYERRESARLGLLLGLPLLWGYAIIGWMDIPSSAFSQEHAAPVACAFLLTVIAAPALLSWLRRRTYLPFVIWRLGMVVYALISLS